MVQKCKSSVASNLDMPRRSCKVLPLKEKVRGLYLIRTGENHAEVAKFYGKNKT
jgi:hypothetical protein